MRETVSLSVNMIPIREVQLGTHKHLSIPISKLYIHPDFRMQENDTVRQFDETSEMCNRRKNDRQAVQLR